MTNVGIAGGGLAGLVAARHLADAGHEVTLFEREAQVGGRIHTDHEDGFTFDRGFQVLFTSYPAVSEELDLDALSIRKFRPGATLARPGTRTTLADPFGDVSATLETLFNREITVMDKLRVLQLRRTLGRKPIADIMEGDDESIDSYLAARGFSERFRNRFAAPFYGGITLDRSLSSSKLVFEYTFKMLAQGNVALPAEGMAAVPEQLAAKARTAGATIETERRVESVEPDAGGIIVETETETLSANAVVVATDPQSARKLTGCESIPTDVRSCVTQYFSLPTVQQLDGGRRLMLNVADDRPNQVAPVSAVAPEYAPRDMQLLSATFLGQQEESDEQLATEVQDALGAWYPENSFAELKLLRTNRIPFAQFTQPPGFRTTLPNVNEPAGQVYLAGDYTEWSSIQGAMASGRRAAEKVNRALRS